MKPVASMTRGCAYPIRADDGFHDLPDGTELYTADQLREVEQQRDELLAAAENLIKVKGRHHTEQAYKALEAAIAKAKP